jgi:hypothetical protein
MLKLSASQFVMAIEQTKNAPAHRPLTNPEETNLPGLPAS